MSTTPRGAFTKSGGQISVGLAGTDYVKQGVVDQSGLVMAEQTRQQAEWDSYEHQLAMQNVDRVTNAIRNVGVGMVKSSVNNEVQDLVDNYTSSVYGPTEAAGLGAMSDAMWANIGDKSKPTNIEDLNVVQQKHAETINKLQRAYKQGAITSLSDLEARVLKVTREAVNRTPGLAQEIMQQSSQVMHLSGVRGMVNPMEQANKIAQKQQEQLQKRLMDYHERNALPYDPVNPDLNEMAKTYQNHLAQRQKYEAFKQEAEDGNRMEDAQRREFLQNHLPDIITDRTNEVRNVAANVFQPGVPFDQAKIQFTSLALQHKQELVQLAARAGVTGDKNGNKQIDMAIKNIDELVATVNEHQDGSSALKAIQNKANYFEATDRIKVGESGINLVAAKAMSALDPLVARMTIKANASEVQAMTNGLMKLTLGAEAWDSDSLKQGVPNPTMITGGMILSNQGEALTKSFEAVARSTSMGMPKNERMTKLTEHFKELGKSDYKGKLKDPDPLMERSFIRASEGFLTDTGTMFQNAIKEANSRLGMTNESLRFGLPVVEDAVGIGKDQEISARAHVLQNGLLDIDTTNDPRGEHANAWRRDIADRYNDVIKTYANVSGVTLKEASDLILSRFGHMLNIPEEELPKVNAKDLIKKEEGFRTKAYLDSAGVPTIGWGFTTIDGRPVKMGDTITREEALTQLEKQLPKYQTFKDKVSVPLTEDQEAALTSFEYNLGSGIWDKGAKSILYAVNAGDFEFAKSQMMQYDKARDPKTGKLKQIPGLSARRGREATMLAKGD